MGTDEDAVEADPGSASKTRADGDGSAFADGDAVATETASASDVSEVDGVTELNGPEAPEHATPEVGNAMAGVPVGSDDDPRDTWSPGLVALDESAEPAAEDALDEPAEPAAQDELDEPAEPAALDEQDESAAEMDQEPVPLVTPPEMSQMVFVDVVLLLPATHPVVVLQEADAPFRELRIPVGGAEGIAISYAARGLATPRPLTHELFTRVLEEFGLTLDVVRITEVRGTAFTAEMVISGRMGTRLIDCRPSDAIALALRHRLPVPIMVEPMVLEVAGTDPMGAN
jgi:bifunctional DNase/RNase